MKSLLRFARTFQDLLLAVLILAALDVGFFHLGAYFPYLKPDSFSGRVEASSRRFRDSLELHPERRKVLLLGDSTMYEAVPEAALEAHLREAGGEAEVLNLAIQGSTPTCWYYLLKHEAVDGAHTAAVVLGVHPGRVECCLTFGHEVDILKTRLTFGEHLELAPLQRKVERKLQVLWGAFFRMPWFREDLGDFLLHPRQREQQLAREAQVEAMERKGWRPGNASKKNLAALRMGENEDELGMRPNQVKKLKARLQSLQQEERRAAPRWILDPLYVDALTHTVHLLNERGVPVVVAVMPNSPFPSKVRDLVELERLVQALEQGGAAVRLYEDPALLDRLEDPLYLADANHLNGEGARLYSEGLAAFLLEASHTWVKL